MGNCVFCGDLTDARWKGKPLCHDCFNQTVDQGLQEREHAETNKPFRKLDPDSPMACPSCGWVDPPKDHTCKEV